MMNNSWNLRGDASTYQKYDKGWSNEEEKPKPIQRHPPEPIQRSGQMSAANPLVHTSQYYRPSTNAGRNSVATKMYGAPPMEKEDEDSNREKDNKLIVAKQPPRPNDPYAAAQAQKKSGPTTGIAIQATQAIPKF
jgi:hypothetical protein